MAGLCCGLSAEQSIPGSSDVFKDWAEIGVAAPSRNAENFPAALPENAIAPDILASELTSNVDVVIAVDLDVEFNPFVEQREIQFIAGDVEFGVGLEAGVPHALENKLLRPTVRPEVRDGGRRLLLRLYFVAQIGSERTQRGYAELIDFRVSDYDEGSPGAADGYVD